MNGMVLVHGGYHGAWCWDDVLPKLDLPAVAVDLPGRGPRPASGVVTIDQCVDAVLEEADKASLDRFLLVGHSLGGLTITETANRAPSRVSRVVYLAALAPKPGQTLFDIFFPDGGGPEIGDPAGVQPLLDESIAHQMFSGDIDDAAFAKVHAQCVPEVNGLFLATVSGYSDVPATYVRCTRDAAVTLAMAENMVANVGTYDVIDLDSDHDAMISHPTEVAAVLNELAAGR